MKDIEQLIGSQTRVEIYTDGGCKPNPGPGGWGAIIRLIDQEQANADTVREWSLSGNDRETTNNQMELHAAISALGLLNGLDIRSPIDLYTDSEYLKQGITQWINGWEQNGWRTKGKEQVKNKILWQNLVRLVRDQDITWHWLKGHADHPHNERADQLATKARLALSKRAVPKTISRDRNAAWPEVTITVKASFNTSLGVGAWGAVIRMGEHTKTIQKREHGITSNALLVRGAAEGLWALSKPCNVTIISDADYLIRGGSQWIKGWMNRDWHTKDGKSVANRAEWETLLAAMEPHHINWKSFKADESPDIALAGELAAKAASGEI
jgi:ribonuclease HI